MRIAVPRLHQNRKHSFIRSAANQKSRLAHRGRAQPLAHEAAAAEVHRSLRQSTTDSPLVCIR
jgi:hypothetical protein